MAKERGTISLPKSKDDQGLALPSGNNDFMAAVCGALGALVFDEHGAKSPADLLGCLNKPSVLYKSLEELNNNIKASSGKKDGNEITVASDMISSKISASLSPALNSLITSSIESVTLLNNINDVISQKLDNILESNETVKDLLDIISNKEINIPSTEISLNETNALLGESVRLLDAISKLEVNVPSVDFSMDETNRLLVEGNNLLDAISKLNLSVSVPESNISLDETNALLGESVRLLEAISKLNLSVSIPESNISLDETNRLLVEGNNLLDAISKLNLSVSIPESNISLDETNALLGESVRLLEAISKLNLSVSIPESNISLDETNALLGESVKLLEAISNLEVNVPSVDFSMDETNRILVEGNNLLNSISTLISNIKLNVPESNISLDETNALLGESVRLLEAISKLSLSVNIPESNISLDETNRLLIEGNNLLDAISKLNLSVSIPDSNISLDETNALLGESVKLLEAISNLEVNVPSVDFSMDETNRLLVEGNNLLDAISKLNLSVSVPESNISLEETNALLGESVKLLETISKLSLSVNIPESNISLDETNRILVEGNNLLDAISKLNLIVNVPESNISLDETNVLLGESVRLLEAISNLEVNVPSVDFSMDETNRILVEGNNLLNSISTLISNIKLDVPESNISLDETNALLGESVRLLEAISNLEVNVPSVDFSMDETNRLLVEGNNLLDAISKLSLSVNVPESNISLDETNALLGESVRLLEAISNLEVNIPSVDFSMDETNRILVEGNNLLNSISTLISNIKLNVPESNISLDETNALLGESVRLLEAISKLNLSVSVPESNISLDETNALLGESVRLLDAISKLEINIPSIDFSMDETNALLGESNRLLEAISKLEISVPSIDFSMDEVNKLLVENNDLLNKISNIDFSGVALDKDVINNFNDTLNNFPIVMEDINQSFKDLVAKISSLNSNDSISLAIDTLKDSYASFPDVLNTSLNKFNDDFIANINNLSFGDILKFPEEIPLRIFMDSNLNVQELQNFLETIGEDKQIIKNIETLKNVLESFLNIKNVKNIKDSTESIIKNLKNTDEAIKAINKDGDAKKHLESIINSLEHLFPSLEKLKSNVDIKSINSLEEIIKLFGVISQINIDGNKVSKNLKNISKIIDTNFKALLSTLEENNINISSEVKKSISILNSLVATFKTLSEIKIKKNRVAKNLRAIHSVLQNNLISIINLIDTSLTELDEGKAKTLGVISDLIDSLCNLDIKPLSLKDLFMLEYNMKKLTDIYITSLTTLSEEISKIQIIEKDKIESLKFLFESIKYFTDPKDFNEDNMLAVIDGIELIVDETIPMIDILLGNLEESANIILKNKDIYSEYFDSVEIVANSIVTNFPSMTNIVLSIIKLNALKTSYDLLNGIISLISSIKKKDLTATKNNLKEINENILTQLTVQSSDNLLAIVTNLAKVSTTAKKIDTEKLTAVVGEIIGVFNTIDSQVKIKADKIKGLGELCLGLSKSMAIISIVGLLGKLVDAGVKVINRNVDTLIEICEKIKDVDTQKISVVIGNFMKMIVGAAALLIFGGIVMNFIDVAGLLSFVGSLVFFIGAMTGAFWLINKIDPKNNSEQLESFMMLIGMCGLVLIAGGLFMNIIDIPSLFAFAGTLAIFIGLVSLPFLLLSKQGKDVFLGAEEFGKLIALSAISLIAGGLFMKIINVLDLITFAGVLLLFVTGLSIPFKLFNKYGTSVMAGVKDFGLLVAISAGVLIAGGLFMKLISVPDLLLFTVTLFGFMVGISFAFKLFNEAKDVKTGAKEFGLLVVMCGAILIAGGLFMKIIDVGGLVTFGVTLIVFMAALAIPMWLFNKAKGVKRGAKEFGLLVVMCGAILIAGGLFMKLIDVEDLLIFAGTLGVFMLLICGAFRLMGGQIRKAMPAAMGLAILTVVCGAVLLIGGAILMNNPGLDVEVLKFAGLMIGYTALMGLLCFGLGTFAGTIGLGLAVLTGIIVVTGLSTVLLTMINSSVSGFGDNYWEKLLKGVGGMSLVILAMAGVCGALGAIAATGIGLAIIGMGAMVVAAISGTAILAAEALIHISKAVEATSKIKKFDAKSIMKSLEDFISIVDVLEPLDGKSWMIRKVSMAVSSMSVMLSLVSKAVADYASLMVPEYDENGRPTGGLVKLTHQNFKEAADNVKEIITTLGGAIIDTYKGNEQMFESTGFLGLGSTPFAKVTTSCSTMGPMLVTIAKAVRDYAELNVPEYDNNGKETGKRVKLTNVHFKEAAENVKEIITTLGGAIINTYKGNEEMFDGSGFLGLGDSPFAKVTNACSTMGPMLVTIAKAVKEYAELSIPEYDNNGKATGKMIPLNSTHFEDAAAHVKEIITTLSGAVMAVYEANPKMFTSFFDKETPFMKVTTACTSMGQMISSIAEGVKTFADLRIKTYDENGKEIGSRSLSPIDFILAGLNIKLITSTLGKAIMEIYEENPVMFILDNGGNPMLKIAQACTEMGNMISSISNGVMQFANLEVNEYIDGRPTGKKIKITKEHFKEARDNVASVISTLGNAIMDVFGSHPDWFTDQVVKTKDGGLFGSDEYQSTGSSLFDKVMGGCSQMANLINIVGDAIVKFASGQIKIGDTYVKVGQPEIAQAVSNIKSIFGTFASIAIVAQNNELFKNPEKVKRELEPAILNMISLIEKSSNAINKFGELNIVKPGFDVNDIASVLLKIAKIHYLLFNDSRRGYNKKYVGNWDFESTFFNELEKGSKGLFTNNMKTVGRNLSMLTDVIRDIIQVNNNLSKAIQSSQSISVETIKEVCSKIIETKENIDSIFGSLNEENSLDTIKNAIVKFHFYNDKLEDFVKIANKVKGQSITGWTSIATSINIINTMMQSITESSIATFKQQNDELDKYITRINNLDLSKVNALKGLIDSLNLLAFKMGNLDNFTEALGEKLTKVLAHLTKQLKEADETIKKADRLQDKRKRAIAESVSQIKEIMNSTLSVEISKGEDGSGGGDISSGGGSAPSGSGDSGSSGSGMPSATGGDAPIDSPAASYNRTEEQGKKAKASSGGNINSEVAKAISAVFGNGVKAKINNKEVTLIT